MNQQIMGNVKNDFFESLTNNGHLIDIARSDNTYCFGCRKCNQSWEVEIDRAEIRNDEHYSRFSVSGNSFLLLCKPKRKTIAQKLDEEFPTKCINCSFPLKRTETLACPRCGLNNQSAEAYSIVKSKNHFQTAN